jgi:fibronectin type 3 domain-containing protein
MKKWLCILFLILAAVGIAVAASVQSVSLQWDANIESDLAGYKVYIGTNSGVYYSSVDVGNTTTTTIGNLKAGVTYYFAATAYNTSRLESGYSNEVSYTVVADVPATVETLR